MSNNINISSGSKSFQNKIFGNITQLTKPSFMCSGKIFSDTTFNNQKIIPLLENSTYYIGHGLPDDFTLFGTTISFGGNTEIQILESIFNTLVDNSPNSIEIRSISATVASLSSTMNGAFLQGLSIIDPYDDNNNECQIP